MVNSEELAPLRERRAALQRRLDKIKADIRGGLSPDFEEQAVELENRDALVEIARVTEEELSKVIRRIAALETPAAKD